MKTRQQLLMDLLDDPRNADRLVAALPSAQPHTPIKESEFNPELFE
ncbi:MAG: hypothetical protein V4735_05315 [Pseudomonadota bacterium]